MKHKFKGSTGRDGKMYKKKTGDLANLYKLSMLLEEILAVAAERAYHGINLHGASTRSFFNFFQTNII